MAWAKNGTPSTLSSTADSIDISDAGELDFNQTMAHVISSGAANLDTELNNDTATNYTSRYSFNGASDSTETSQGEIHGNGFTSRDNFDIMYIVGIDSEEKLVIRFTVDREAAGSGTAPSRLECVGKWVNTSNSITQISLVNNLAGDYASDSNLSALGTD